MASHLFLLFIGLFSLSYGGISYYVGLRGWQSLGSRIPFLPAKVYWAVFWFIALSYLAGRLGEIYAPGVWSKKLILIGSYWLGAMYYFFLILIVIDLVRWLDKVVGFLPGWVPSSPRVAPAIGLAVVALVSGLVIYGSWNALHPRVQRYDLTIRKPAGDLKELRAVLISDTHLGIIVGRDRLKEMVATVNKLAPDIVLLAGDIIDERIDPFVEGRMAEVLRDVRTKYGVFAVLGNHEYIGGQSEEAVRHLEEAGIRVLRDEWVKVADSFYVVGRESSSGQGFTREAASQLSAIISEVDGRVPVILMDHEPNRLAEAEAAGVDLQLSGHTHVGQLFPNRLITRRVYEVDWGLLRKGDFQVIVTSGYATWGPPMRVGNRPELVEMVIRFEP
jgi:predicted MPP superfamily phosphohydrolase